MSGDLCIRAAGHDGPCNGYPRKECEVIAEIARRSEAPVRRTPPMPDKTPLELADIAERMGMACPTTQSERVELAHGYMRVAAALIERMTPVEIQLLPGATRGVCQCGDTPEYDARFCEDCGAPITWK